MTEPLSAAAENGGADRPAPESRASGRARDWLVSLVTLVVGALIVAGLIRYNFTHRVGDEYLVVNLCALLFVPLLLVFGLFGESAEAFGFRRPEAGAARVAWAFLAFMLPFLLLASRWPAFRMYYPMRPEAAYSWTFFAYHEVSYGLYLFGWEFFYRGFLTFGLARRFGFAAAIVLQALAFGAMHWTKPAPEFAGSFVAGIALGWLAVRGRSFLPCFALHWLVSAVFDVLAIHARAGGIF